MPRIAFSSMLGFYCSAVLAILLAVFVVIVVSPPAAAHNPAHDEPPPPEDPLTLAPRAEPQPLGPGNWPMYGRNLANSRNARRAGPERSAAKRLGPVWSFRSLAGDFTGTPVVASGVLVIGARDGTVFGLDAATGELRWSTSLPYYISGSAAIDRGRVYVPLTRPQPAVAALRLRDGQLLWLRVVDHQAGADMYGSPVVWRDTIYVGVSAGLAEEEGLHTRGALVALRTSTGKVRWRRRTVPRGFDGAPIWTTPAIDTRRGRVYAGTGNAYHRPIHRNVNAILAFNARTGRIVGRYQASKDVHRGGHQGPDLDFGASPNLLPGGLVGDYQKSRLYWGLDRSSLALRWKTLTARAKDFPAEAISSTAFDGDGIYGQTEYAQVWSLDHRGRRRWLTTAPGHRANDNYSPVAVSNGVLYNVDAHGFLYVRSTRTGRQLARLPLGGFSWGGVSIAGGSVFAVTGVAEEEGYVVAYRPRRG